MKEAKQTKKEYTLHDSIYIKVSEIIYSDEKHIRYCQQMREGPQRTQRNFESEESVILTIVVVSQVHSYVKISNCVL